MFAGWQEEEVIAALAGLSLLVFLSGGALIATRKKPEFAGHPRGLYVLFFAEMWERFSYYGMRAILIFYLVRHWDFSQSKATLIFGAYTSLVYITPVLGGYLADRYLGQRKAVLFGGIMLALGHGLMAVEGIGGQSDPTINVFWLALSFIIIGSGFLKANISVIVGQLYPRTDIRRDGAYTIFYMGINVGAAIGTILVGYLGETVGWKYGFGLAGIGMIAGLLVFIVFRPLLLGRGESPDPARLAAPVAGIRLEWLLYAVSFLAVGVIWVLIQYQNLVGGILLGAGSLLLIYVLIEAFRLEREPRHRIFAILFLIALQPLFWGLFEQAGGSLNLFTDSFVDRSGVPASLFQSINPIYIVIFAPMFAAMWIKLARRGLEPSAPAKFGLALIQLGFGFIVLNWGAAYAGVDGRIPVLFLFLIYLFHTTGELCLSPVGLSAMNRLAPRHLASLVMGAWFFATAGGNFVAGKIGEASGGGEHGQMTRDGTLAIYWKIGLLAMGIGVVVLALSFLVKKLMHLDTLKDDSDIAGQAELGEPAAAGMHPGTAGDR